MKLKHLFIAFILTGGITTTFSQKSSDDNNWIVIAKRDVAYRSGESDKIIPTGKERNVSKIKVKCTQGTLKLKKLSVRMDDGTKKDFKTKSIGILSRGMSSFSFDLPGNDTKLRSIRIEYEALGGIGLTKRAKVEILGKKRKD